MAGGSEAQEEGIGRRPSPFRAGESCPDCGAAHWLIGRQSAECAGCGTPLPRAAPEPLGAARARFRSSILRPFRPAA